MAKFKKRAPTPETVKIYTSRHTFWGGALFQLKKGTASSDREIDTLKGRMQLMREPTSSGERPHRKCENLKLKSLESVAAQRIQMDGGMSQLSTRLNGIQGGQRFDPAISAE